MESLLDLIWFDEEEDVAMSFGDSLVGSVCLVLCQAVSMGNFCARTIVSPNKFNPNTQIECGC